MTDFSSRCDILGKLYAHYRNETNMQDFFEFNDLGLPLAYHTTEGLCMPSEDGCRYINETWDMLMESLELSDIGFEDLEELFQAVVNKKEQDEE